MKHEWREDEHCKVCGWHRAEVESVQYCNGPPPLRAPILTPPKWHPLQTAKRRWPNTKTMGPKQMKRWQQVLVLVIDCIIGFLVGGAISHLDV